MATEPLTRVSSADFSKDVDQYIEKANATHAMFEVEGRGQSVVVMAGDEYRSIMETLHLLSTPANAKALYEALAEAKAGKLVEFDPRRR